MEFHQNQYQNTLGAGHICYKNLQQNLKVK